MIVAERGSCGCAARIGVGPVPLWLRQEIRAVLRRGDGGRQYWTEFQRRGPVIEATNWAAED